MWKATYKNVDKTGLQPELKVTVEYTNDNDSAAYLREYTVMPVDFGSDGFNAILQTQIDILDAKDAITIDAITAVVDKPILLKPTPVEVTPL